jgi:ribosomal-protein-alanine N-acetyltransferase
MEAMIEKDTRPTLETKRLILRPFYLSDASECQRLAGDKRIAQTTATIPHPYPDGAAESWIEEHSILHSKGTDAHFAVTLKSNKQLIGCVALNGISKTHGKGELGYWITVDLWNKGYCTEAAQAVVKYGFETLKLNKIVARHVDFNPSSGKVMQKIGMKKEGHLIKDMFRMGKFCDVELYGILNTN